MAVDLSFRESGAGSPLIILHGLFGSGTNWRTIARALSATHHVFTVDQRNHGNSPHTDSMSYFEMAEDIVSFMDKRSLSSAVLLGHSMGGKVAMVTALENPERVEKLIVVDIAPVTYKRNYSRFFEAMRSIKLTWVGRRDDASRQMKVLVPEIGLRTFLLQNLVSDGHTYRWRIALDGIETQLASLLAFPEITRGIPYVGRTLFVRGERSDYVLPEHHPEIRKRFPGAEVITVEGAGHWLHVEQPRRFVDSIKNFTNSPVDPKPQPTFLGP